MSSITVSRLKEVLKYDPLTGIFLWLKKPRQRAMSAIAGSINPYGYRQICIDQKTYKAHRLAWFFVYEEWPIGAIDHVNRSKDDNRIANLRPANHSLNQANSKLRTNNKCGFKGVYLHKISGLYMARVTYHRKNILIGYYKTPEEAHAAYIGAAREYFGEYARAS